jgi:hypothetical protein
VDFIVSALTALAALAGIVQTVVALVERSERKRLERMGRTPPIYTSPYRSSVKSERITDQDAAGRPTDGPLPSSHSPGRTDGYNWLFGSNLDDADRSAANRRSSLAYLIGFVAALIFRKNPSAKVRFHAIQSLWIDILSISYFILGFVFFVIYIIFRYPDDQQIPDSDAVGWTYLLTSLLSPPIIHIVFAILVITDWNPRIPLVWKIAATVTIRQQERLDRSGQSKRETPADQYTQIEVVTEKHASQRTQQEVDEHAQYKATKWTKPAWLLKSVQRRPVGLLFACVVLVLAIVMSVIFIISQPGAIIVRTISVGPKPWDIEVGEGFVWTANSSSDTISRINPMDGTSEEIKVGGNPSELGVDRGAVWVWNYVDAITRVDAHTGEVSQPITGGSPDAPISAIDVGNGYVWLSHENGTITRINMQTQALEGDPIAVGPKPTRIAFGDNRLYVVNSEDNTISTLDGSTGKALGTPLKINQKLGGILVYDGVIYVWSTDDRTQLPLPDQSVIPIDEQSFVIGKPISLNGGSSFAVGAGSGWVAYPFDNVLRRIDLQTGQPQGEPITDIGKEVGDMEFADNMLWVSNLKENTVTQIRPSS